MEYSLKYLSYEEGYLVNALEAVLFAGGDPVEVDKLAALFDITKNEVAIVSDDHPMLFRQVLLLLRDEFHHALQFLPELVQLVRNRRRDLLPAHSDQNAVCY